MDAVGHRIVHGGAHPHAPVRLDKEVRDHIAALTELAPLHQSRGVAGIDAVGAVPPAPVTSNPGLVLWLPHHSGINATELPDVLEHRSGLAGLTGR